MLKYPVIAAYIANLTDARYFAARGVDHLLYDLDQIQVAEIAEIQEWVSGPTALLLFSDKQLELLDEAIIKLAPVAIGTKTMSNAGIEHMAGHVAFFEWKDSIIELDDTTYVDFTQHNGNPSQGIILMGGNEDMIGVKSYDDLDEILDQLEID